ncbi:MAG: hypothetical protein IJZ37_04390 [Clostridia bacterium]|nr:hypothetical protein [Clostridia bacterium]
MKSIKKSFLPMVALLVSLMLLLPSCGSTYQVTMDGLENGGENPSKEPEGGKELSLPEKPSQPEELPPAQSLLPDETTKEPDPVTNALQELLNMKQYTDAGFVGFSYDLRYFVADFRGTALEENYGLGCYLFMADESLSARDLQNVCNKLEEMGLYKQLFLFFMTEEYKEVINENLARIEGSADLQQMLLSFFDTETAQKLCDFLKTEDGKALLSLYHYVEEPQEGFPLVEQGSYAPEPPKYQ